MNREIYIPVVLHAVIQWFGGERRLETVFFFYFFYFFRRVQAAGLQPRGGDEWVDVSPRQMDLGTSTKPYPKRNIPVQIPKMFDAAMPNADKPAAVMLPYASNRMMPNMATTTMAA